ncbi:hypothetical protein AB1Y20_010018 [Prymnesium parvum]|uniref:Uncharacterized protein n=1 Tax=Prymnesium parvum TaxID=97485 RepID=A0AB34K5N8_PRYPA
MGRTCERCGKVLKGSTDEALQAHQRENESCRPRAGAKESQRIKELDAKLQLLIEEGRALGMRGGSFEASEKNERERAELQEEIKRLRQEHRDEKKMVKTIAQESLSAASWTQSLAAAFSGDGDARFTRGDNSIDQRLASETVGLVSTADFRAKRLAIEMEATRKQEIEDQKEQERIAMEKIRKREKKQKREQEQRRTLSFDEADDG